MAEREVEAYQRWQSARIAQEIIAQSSQQDAFLLEKAQKAWQEARQQLVEILKMLDPDLEQASQRCGRALESYTAAEIGLQIGNRIRLTCGRTARTPSHEEIQKLKLALQEQNSLNSGLEQKISQLESERKQLQAEKEALQAHLSALRQVPTQTFRDTAAGEFPDEPSVESPEVVLPVPEWYRYWQNERHFEQASAAVQLLGTCGNPLFTALTRDLAEQFSLSRGNRLLDFILQELVSKERGEIPPLMEWIQTDAGQSDGAGGVLPRLLRLSPQGQTACQLLTGRTPVDNLYDRLIGQHATPEHAILNIQALDVLQQEGFQIAGLVQHIQLSGGETYIPDITARLPGSGMMIFIEVERGAAKDIVYRKQKWMKAYEASNGNLFVFCDNQRCQRAVCTEINHALGDLPFNCSLTNLHALRHGKRSLADGSIWISQKKGKRNVGGGWIGAESEESR